MPTEARFVSNYKDGAWDEGVLTADDKVVIQFSSGYLYQSLDLGPYRRPFLPDSHNSYAHI